MPRSSEGLERFEQLTGVPMFVLAVVSVPLLLAPILWDLPAGVEDTIFALDWFIWGAFALEYGIRLYLAPARGIFFRKNLIDLAVVALPMLRPLRLARTARILRLAGLVRAGVMLGRAGSALRLVMTRHHLNHTLFVAGAALVTCSLLVYELERSSSDGNIRSVADALWWGLTTITTVGYGDRFPVTPQGRAVGAILMVLGITLFGLLAATLSSFMIERDQQKDIDPQLQEIGERLARIEEALSLQGEENLPEPPSGRGGKV